MISIYGYFKDIKNNTRYDVSLVKLSSQTTSYSIEEGSDTICFDWSEPVTIETDYQDTFKHVIIKQANINLIVNDNLKNVFFSGNGRDFSVTVQVHDGPVLFKGYLDPLVFQEPYAKQWTKLTLSCSDKIATLQYKKYGELPNINPNAQDKPITIINNILDSVGLTADITPLSNEVKNILNNTYINNQLLFGESPDDWKKCDEVLEEIGKYAGIWFSQEEDDKVRCFSWHNSERSTPKEITSSDYAGSDTTLSVSDVYTQIKLTCNLQDQATLAEFGSSNLRRCYPSYVKYLEEFVSDGEGKNATYGIISLVGSDGATTDYDEAYVLYNYMNVLRSETWEFPDTNYLSVVEQNPNAPQAVLAWLRNNPGKGAFLEFGKTERQTEKNTNPINSLSLNECLLISVMGKDSISDTTVLNAFNGSYICKYTGQASSITPPNTKVKNYIIISGKIFLNPLYAQSSLRRNMHRDDGKHIGGYFGRMDGSLYQDSLHTYQEYKQYVQNYYNSGPSWFQAMIYGTVPCITDNDWGGYYLHRFFTGTTEVETSTPMLYGDLKWSKYQKQWEYKMSQINGSSREVDNISKIPILICSLKVGNKYCVERTDEGSSGWNKFEWLTVEQAAALNLEPVFSIGIDPKIGDFILGNDLDIANTVTYHDNVDGKGTAIPIKADDYLTGEFEFKIVRPANTTWNYTSNTYKSWWSWLSDFWGGNDWPIVQKLSSIIVKNFKVEVVSDKGGNTNLNEDADLVYASDMNDNYLEEHEEDIFLSTMLTSDECVHRDVDVVISPSHLMKSDGSPYLGMTYTTHGTYTYWNKPEDYYVNDFYNEYSVPRTVIESSLNLNQQFGYIISPYTYNFTLPYTYYKETGYFVPVKYEASIKEDKVKYTMKNMS